MPAPPATHGRGCGSSRSSRPPTMPMRSLDPIHPIAIPHPDGGLFSSRIALPPAHRDHEPGPPAAPPRRGSAPPRRRLAPPPLRRPPKPSIREPPHPRLDKRSAGTRSTDRLTTHPTAPEPRGPKGRGARGVCRRRERNRSIARGRPGQNSSRMKAFGFTRRYIPSLYRSLCPPS